MIYLASPYSHKDPSIREKRFLLIEELTAKMIKEGKMVFSPIVHCHNLSISYNLSQDFEFWQKYCLYFIDKADMLMVYMIEGWKESKGIKEEIEYAKFKDIPIDFIR